MRDRCKTGVSSIVVTDVTGPNRIRELLEELASVALGTSEPDDWPTHRRSSTSCTYKAPSHAVRRLGESLASARGLRRANGRTLAKGLLEDTDRFGDVLNLDDVWWQKTQDVAGRAIDQQSSILG